VTWRKVISIEDESRMEIEMMMAGEAARLLGISPGKLGDYERMGVFTARRDQTGRRIYTEADLVAIRAHMAQRVMHRPKQKEAACST